MKAFERIPFDDSEAAAACLDNILDITGHDLADALLAVLADTADPMRALVGLTRFFERCISPSAEAAFMAAGPEYLRMLATLFSQSALLSDILCRNPEYAAWLWSEAALERGRACDEIQEELARAFQTHGAFEERCAWMRRYSRRELLRVATREVYKHAPFSSVVSDISLLADTMIEAAYIAARDVVQARFGRPVSEEAPEREVTFCVLALGKLGGGELNFSSDVDLIFLYSAVGQARKMDEPGVSTEEYYRKLSELMIKALSEQTAEGQVFRVDMRLRPFGKSGPLACSLDSAVEYYSTYGRAWERQALIKARACAGDIPLGETLLERLRPFIYPRYFDDATLEDIRGIKQQTESRTMQKAESEREVKLGRGGIRDIEFTAQMLQLLDGGRWPDLRTTNTLDALRALGARQRLSPFEAKTLESNYIFLRQVEHRLQIEGGLQTHVLPESQDQLNLLARRMGYETGDAFMNVYRERGSETRRILERFLAIKGDGNLWVIELLDPESDCASGLKKLRDYGFAAPERARLELLALANGPEEAPHTRDTAQQFAAVTPFLLDAMSKTPDPDATLLRFSQILVQLPTPATLYNLLKSNTKLTAYLSALIANSDYFTELLVRDISMLDLIGAPGFLETPSRREAMEAELAALEQAANPAPALYRLRDSEMLKVALRELAQGVSVAAVGDELTLLAEVIVNAATRRARAAAVERYGAMAADFAVLALGKFGGREMGYGSDLDLIFVYDQHADKLDTSAAAPTEFFAAMAAKVLNTLKEPTRHGILYEVDARLRPDGSKGALAITDQRLRQYYEEEAQFWERFALMKVRAVAGDEVFMNQVESMARDIAFSRPPNRPEIEKLEAMHRQLADAASPFDLKRREGGIAEIESAVRLLQLRHVGACPELKRGGVFHALDMLRDKALIADEAFRTLRDGYAFYRRLLNRARMMRGSTSSRIPDNPEALHRLKRCLGMQDDIEKQVTLCARKTHLVYQHVFTDVGDKTPE